MNLHTIFSIIIGFTVFFGSQPILAQTCRVSTGKLDNGCVVYTEVYEYDYVDVKPEFPGGGRSLINFINSHRVYPQEAYENGIQGKVTCSFVVNIDGKLSHIKVLRGVERSLNNEAVRIISQMPEWKPGSIDNHLVPVRVVCSIPFRH